MTNAELIAKIKAEIDKRYAGYRKKMKTDDFTYYEGMADALDLFEQFLDTLEESEKPNQDELERELRKEIAYFAINGGSGDDTPTIGEIARHFAKWGAENLKK